MKKIILFSIFIITSILILISCNSDENILAKKTSTEEKENTFSFINEQTASYIAVYGSKTITIKSYNRAYADVKSVMDDMDDGIKQGLLNAEVKILIVKDEDELENKIDYFMTLLPIELIYTNNEGGADETFSFPTDVGLSNTKLKLMYLCVYYSLLVEHNLLTKYIELKKAYNEVAGVNTFTPVEAYVDSYEDKMHQNASEKDALKYGSYLFNLYKVYFGNNNAGVAEEFTITTKKDLKDKNLLGYNFMEENFE